MWNRAPFLVDRVNVNALNGQASQVESILVKVRGPCVCLVCLHTFTAKESFTVFEPHMSSAAVWKAANSAPSRRNYAGEIEVLLQQSEEKCKAAAEIDMGSAIMKAESRLSSAADQALQRGADAAEVARAKIAEQQDRFKTGLQVDGIHLDATMVESGRAQQAQQPFLANKYSMQMSHHKTLQDHERMSRGKAVP